MRRSCTFLVVLAACFSESDDPNGGDDGESTGPSCPVGAVDCACRPDGDCDAGLLCVDARCEAPQADTGSSSTNATSDANPSSTSTSEGSTDGSAGTTTVADTSSSDTSGAPECGSGMCNECFACAMNGPCSDAAQSCAQNECGTTPLCVEQCVEGMHGCTECCFRMLQLATDYIACFEAQCGPACGFMCPG